MKWFLFAGAVLAGAYLAGLALRSSDVARPWIAGLVLVAGVFLPVSLGIAIVKHRLYEIDRLISRTLAFGALWLVATAGYVGIAAALGIVAGGRLPVEIAVVCTIIATLLVNPPGVRLERLVDRWVGVW